MIVSLALSIYVTYLDNVYFQTYVNSLSPILVPVLSVAFGISSASIATYLYLGMKRFRTFQGPEVLVKKRIQPRRTQKRSSQSSTPPPKVADLTLNIPAELKPIAPPQSGIQTQTPPSKEGDNRSSNPENRKQL